MRFIAQTASASRPRLSFMHRTTTVDTGALRGRRLGRRPLKLDKRKASSLHRRTPSTPIWDTSSNSLDVETSPLELELLGKHARTCASLRDSWFVLRLRCDALQAFAMSRPISILIV